MWYFLLRKYWIVFFLNPLKPTYLCASSKYFALDHFKDIFLAEQVKLYFEQDGGTAHSKIVRDWISLSTNEFIMDGYLERNSYKINFNIYRSFIKCEVLHKNVIFDLPSFGIRNHRHFHTEWFLSSNQPCTIYKERSKYQPKLIKCWMLMDRKWLNIYSFLCHIFKESLSII